MQLNFRKLITFLALLAMAPFLPWHLFSAFVFLSMIFIQGFWPAIFFALMIDAVYSVPEPLKFYGRFGVFTAVFFIVFLIIEYARKQIRV